MRLLNLIVAAALVLAAGYVYKIKVAATVEAERVAKLRMEIVRERDAIAALRAEAAKLENPGRIQHLADRHLSLKPLDPAQIDTIDSIPLHATDEVVDPEIVTAAPAQPNAAAPQSKTATAQPNAAAPQPKAATAQPKTAPTDPATGSVRPRAPAR